MNRAPPCILAVLVALPWWAFGAEGEDEPVPAYEVFQLRVEGGSLVLRTTMPATPEDEFRTITLAGVGGRAELVNSGADGAFEDQTNADDDEDADGDPDAVAEDDDDDDGDDAGPGKGGAGDAAARAGGAGDAGEAPAGDESGKRAGEVGRRGRRAVVPNLFKLSINNDDVPGQRAGTTVSWHDGALDVQKGVYHTGARRYTRLTRLVASRNPEFGPGPSVQLVVTESGDIGREAVRVAVTAPDFFALRRAHPAEVDEHVRPLLRELGQEAVFAPEPQVAWQVFADRWEPDAAVVNAVKRLLPGLDADDGRAREAASARVAGLGQEAVLVLLQLDRTGLSAEQHSRIDVLIADHTPLAAAEAERLRGDVPFLLDCLNSDDARTRAAALDHLREAARAPVEFDVKLPVPARGAAVAALRAKLLPATATAGPGPVDD